MSVSSCRTQATSYNGVYLSPKYSQFSQSRTVENGRVIYKTDFTLIDVAENNKDFYSSDFSMENLLALGAVSQLKEVSFSGDSKVDDLISVVSNMKEDFSHAKD